MTNKIQFSGKTLDDALSEAAKYYNVDKAFICHNTISNPPKSGFLSKIFNTKVQIEAWVETAKEDLQEAARKAVREALNPKKVAEPNVVSKRIVEDGFQKKKKEISQLKDVDHSENFTRTFVEFKDPHVKEFVENYNNLFFSAFGLCKQNYTTKIQDNQLTVHVEDPFLEDILTKSDKLSLAYEHVLKRVAQKIVGDISGRASIDAGASEEKREERLVGIAKSLAEKVRKTGKSVVLASKSSHERRIIHMALDGLEGIATRSIGMGDKRRLVIFSASENNSTQKHKQEFPKKVHLQPRKSSKNSNPKNSPQKKNRGGTSTNDKSTNNNSNLGSSNEKLAHD